MRTVTYNLIQLLTEAQRGSFKIPRFQRHFVWNNAQVKLLVDSISKNYPIGSLLLLQETIPSDPFLASRKIDAVIHGVDNYEEDSEDESSKTNGSTVVYYVLDGQQRLTSLVRVFLKASGEYCYYFDLDQLYESDLNEKNPAAWIKKRGQNRKLSMRYLRSDMVTEAEVCEVFVQEYFESDYSPLHGDRRGQRQAAAKVNRMFETMRNYQLPLVIIDRGDSTEAICRIFETINSTGTRLTTFDLAVARFFPDPDLHKLWQQSKNDFPILERFSVEGERVLQLIVSLVGSSENKYLELTRSALLKLKKTEIKGLWEVATKALAGGYQWIENHGATPGMIANDALLVPVSYFLNKIDSEWKKKNPNYLLILEKWFFAHSLQQGARQASNYRIGLAVSSMNNWIISGDSPEMPDVRLRKSDLLNLFKSDTRYRAIHSLLRWRNPCDLWTNEIIDACDVEDHHIFPAVISKREGDRNLKRNIDSIVNRILVSKATNRMLGARYPADYLGNLIKDARMHGALDGKISLFQKSCLPVIDVNSKILDKDNFCDFLDARAELILAAIKVVIGDLLNSKSSSDDEDDIEGDD